SLLLPLEEGTPESAGLSVAIGRRLWRRIRAGCLGNHLDMRGIRLRGRRVERELRVLELLLILLAEQLAHELPQLLRIEAIARDQRVEIGRELRSALV